MQFTINVLRERKMNGFPEKLREIVTVFSSDDLGF